MTSAGEEIELDYSCWVYYIRYAEAASGSYLIVKASNGNLLEVNVKNDAGPDDLPQWSEITAKCSVWKSTNGVVLTFYPSEQKVQVRTLDELSSTYFFFSGTWSDELLGYYVIDNKLYFPEFGPPEHTWFKFFWIITYISENEMVLSYGNALPAIYVSQYRFICQTNFNKI